MRRAFLRPILPPPDISWPLSRLPANPGGCGNRLLPEGVQAEDRCKHGAQGFGPVNYRSASSCRASSVRFASLEGLAPSR